MRFESAPGAVARIRQFFTNSASSGSRRRSGAGMLLALVMIPILLGVMACLPVPVGDPEKSRVDKDMSGVWQMTGSDAGQMLMVLDPYDKRTWLMTLIGLGTVGDEEPVDENGSGQEGAPQVRFSAANAAGFKAEGIDIYKCWLTRIKGETFITWESKTLSDTLPEMVPEAWWVFRVRKSGADTFFLDSFDYSIDGLDKVQTSKEAEKIIRRHMGDPGFFKDDEGYRLDRLPEEDVAALPRMLKDLGIGENL